MKPTGIPLLLILTALAAHQSLDSTVAATATISGRVLNHESRPVANANMIAIQIEGPIPYRPMVLTPHTDTHGNYIIRGLPEGRYRVRADWMDPAMVISGARPTYQQTYFPSTENARDAVAINLARGAHVTGIDIKLLPSKLLSITGQVTGAARGEAIDGYLLWGRSSIRTLKIGADGALQIPFLEPARYTVVVHSRDRRLAGTTTVDLKTNLTGLTIPLQPTVTLAGRVVTTDGAALPESLQVAAVLAVNGQPIDPLTRDRADVGPDGSFAIQGVFGERVFALVGQSDWRIERVVRTEPGMDIRDLRIVISRQQ